jgi:membrane associated rhomboid family serine protease
MDPASMTEDPKDDVQRPQDGRQPVFNIPAIVVALTAICIVVHLVRLYLLTIEQDFGLLLRAAFIPIRYSGQFDLDVYAFTSPFTYTFLHGSVIHLAINMIWLAAFGSPLANRLGIGRFLLFWAVTGIAAAATHYVLHMTDQSPLIGASGAISGMMGAAARFGFRASRVAGRSAFDGPLLRASAVLRIRSVVTFLAVWMAINLVTGLVGLGEGADRIAWEAHVGGFVAGFFGIGAFVAWRRAAPQ